MFALFVFFNALGNTHILRFIFFDLAILFTLLTVNGVTNGTTVVRFTN